MLSLFERKKILKKVQKNLNGNISVNNCYWNSFLLFLWLLYVPSNICLCDFFLLLLAKGKHSALQHIVKKCNNTSFFLACVSLNYPFYGIGKMIAITVISCWSHLVVHASHTASVKSLNSKCVNWFVKSFIATKGLHIIHFCLLLTQYGMAER